MNKKIAILLPYKEIYSENLAGAASIWVKDYIKCSKLSSDTLIFGNLAKKLKPISKNFVNINITNILFSKNKTYTETFYKEYLKNKFEIIEIHNRAESLKYLIDKKIKSKLIFFFHNNPKEIRGSRTVQERIFLMNNTDRIFFVSKWTMNKFFEGLPVKSKVNCEVLYPAIEPPKKFYNKKQNQIMFAGKLNSSKGYDLFGKAIIKLLNKHINWNSVVVGNEPREKFNFKHKKLKIYDWLPHKKVLNLYKKSSISVVPSKWEEPFGRTAMESAAYGCATITSPMGGLTETFNNNLVLKKTTVGEIFRMVNKLIKNEKFLKKNQLKNFGNVLHKIKDQVNYIDSVKNNLFEKKVSIITNRGPKILHISNFNERNNHRLFNISIATKLSNGFVRNKCDVINFSYRNYLSKKLFSNLDKDILEIANNYKPDLILFGHNNILKAQTLEVLNNNNIKTSLWYEDHLAHKGPNWLSNLNLLEKNNSLIDNYFVTTHPSVIKTNIIKKKLFFMPIPVDKNIESLDIYKYKHRYKDLFFALSHGVNYGGLRKYSRDERENFINELIKKGKDIKFHFLGINNDAPKWNYDFYKEMMLCKMSLNLSRGTPLKYASSNRIASYMGNGILTFIDEKVGYQDFFSRNEMLFYKDINDLCNQIQDIKNNLEKINQISKKGKKKYFDIFNNLIVSGYILKKSLDHDSRQKYAWDK